MAITFAMRGTFTAYQSTGSSVGFPSDSAAVTSAADGGALSGNSINMSGTANESVIFTGVGNAGANRARSMLFRYKPNYTGTPAANRPLFQLGLGRGARGPFIEFWHASITGKITVNGHETTDNTIFSSATFTTAFSPTSGTWYDLFWSWDGLNTAGGMQFWVDASSIGTLTAARSLVSPWKAEYFTPVTFDATTDITGANNSNIDEVVIWDTQITDPTTISLDSGSGSLNGASRSSLVAATNVDGSVWTALAANKILTGNSQTQAGVVVNGSAVAGALFRNPSLAGT